MNIKGYLKQLNKELKEQPNLNETLSNIKLSLEKESKLIFKEIKPTSILILLDIKGETLDSIEFADFLKKSINQSNKKEIIFIIGSSHGVDDNFKQICNYRISFSKMTFCKELFKVIFIEQLYRALTIINNINYHK